MTLTVIELINLLRQHDPEAEVYAAEELATGQPFTATAMREITGISPAQSDQFGAAVLLDLGD